MDDGTAVCVQSEMNVLQYSTFNCFLFKHKLHLQTKFFLFFYLLFITYELFVNVHCPECVKTGGTHIINLICLAHEY